MLEKLLLLIILFQYLKHSIAISSKTLLIDDDLTVSISTSGSYSLSIKNTTWLTSSEVFLQANGVFNTIRDNSLILNGSFVTAGSDLLGNYQKYTFVYSVQNDQQTTMDCSIITYNDLPIVRFNQNFKNGVKLTKTNFNQVSSSFPSFLLNNIVGEKIGFLSYGGMMGGDMEKLIGRWNQFTTKLNDGMQGGPLVLFNQEGDTLVISPMSSFMSASMEHKLYIGGSINFGIMGGVNTIPENYTVDFIVYYGSNGINNAMQGWGSSLRKFYNKNDKFLKNDYTTNYLGYWTDNGAYYYWLTENGKNYQDTILDVVTAFDYLNIPFRYMQYDSWWYGGPLGLRGGCSLWDSPVDVFPNGMKYLYDQTKLPASAHNKYWDQNVLYAKQNGGKYNFLVDTLTMKSLPDDQQFWNDLMFNATNWGLLTYEQDWLNHQTLDFTPLISDIDLGRRWLLQMGNSAEKFNITIQYCMSLSRHVLQSVEIPAVTQVRVTNDYATNWQYGGEQWRIGVSSIFASALGLAPFKDVFWSTEIQANNRYGPKATEPYPELESAISTLSSGPVGPGDKIGCMDKDIIMRCCNDDGLILKPSKAITAIDAQIYEAAFGSQSKKSPFGEIWSTYSEINEFTFGIVLGIDIKNYFYITPQNCGFNVTNNTVFWKYGDYENVYPFTNPQSVKSLEFNTNCTKKYFCLYYISPVVQISGRNIAFLGEKNKWVPASSQRIESIQVSSNSLIIYVNGSFNEKVNFVFTIDNTPTDVICSFNNNTQLKIMLINNNLTCN